MSTTGSTRGQVPAVAPAVAPEIPAPAPVIIKPLKINTPEPFDGSRGKLRAFFSQIELFFGFNINRFLTDKHKVLFASTYLRGPAFKWFNSFLTDFLNNEPDKRDDNTIEVTQNYLNFKNKLRQVFGDFDKEHLAECRMQLLWQTGSAANYASKFQQLAAQTQWGAVPLVAQFYKGLKDRVKDNVARVNQPSQLQSMITLAIRIGDRQYKRELERKGTYNFGKKDRYQKSPKKNQYGMVPMELDATEKRNQSPRKETRKCYNCGKIGHLKGVQKQETSQCNPI